MYKIAKHKSFVDRKIKKCMNKFLTIITLITFSLNFCKSQNLELSLKQLFEKANALNLPLLIVRYDQSMLESDPSYADFILDSLMNASHNKFIIDTEFVVYKLDSESSKEEDIEFQKQFIMDYTPNFILHSSKGELLHFYNPISYESENDNIVQDLRDTLNIKSKLLLTRLNLEKKFVENNISNKDLYELIKIRNSVHLKTQKEINEYVRLGNNIDLYLMEIINQQTFKMSDSVTEHLLTIDEQNKYSNAFNLLTYFRNICEKAWRYQDLPEFEQAQKWKVFYEKKAIEEMNKEFLGDLFFNSSIQNNFVTQKDLIERLSLYTSSNDLVNIVKVGNEIANNVLNSYKSDKKEYVQNELAKGDFLMKGTIELNPTMDSTFLKSIEYREKNRDKIILKYENLFDENIANHLNTVSWTFYEKVTETSELKKALKWSKKSIELHSTAANLDTYAHLLFKLGHKKKAIKYEQKALEMAVTEGNDRYVEEFKQEILKFKSIH